MMHAKELLNQIRALPLTQTVKIMNVCGGHERSINRAALRSLLPQKVELIPGPGCPVCICPESDIRDAITLSQQDGMRVASFGDMLRVPINAPKGQARSLLQAKERGGRVHAIASPMEVITLAQRYPQDKIIFLAAGFETTMAPVAAMLAQNPPSNIYLLLAGRLTYPIVRQLLTSGQSQFDALIAPGHVATIMGAEEWSFVSDEFNLPCAVAGFEIEDFLGACLNVLRQKIQGDSRNTNTYERVAKQHGNAFAQKVLAEEFKIIDAQWRGIGMVEHSGFKLADHQQARDARQFIEHVDDSNLMPQGCDCAQVVLGQIYPDQCPLYGRTCTPSRPVGPCMVSDEGACQLWWANGVRTTANVE
jgi:hydrogenase expression/formation protein HypD